MLLRAAERARRVGSYSTWCWARLYGIRGLTMVDMHGQLNEHSRSLRPSATKPIRILAVSHTWQGANDYSYVRALRQAGHSVIVVSDEVFFPTGWRHPMLKALRRALKPALVAEYNRHLVAVARSLQPELFFVYKGNFVSAQTLKGVKETGAVAINVYPDTNFAFHSRMLVETMHLYDWVFTTKSFHVEAPPGGVDPSRLSFLPHGFDPEVHRPVALDERDRAPLRCRCVLRYHLDPRKRAIAQRPVQACAGHQFENLGQLLGECDIQSRARSNEG